MRTFSGANAPGERRRRPDPVDTHDIRQLYDFNRWANARTLGAEAPMTDFLHYFDELQTRE